MPHPFINVVAKQITSLQAEAEKLESTIMYARNQQDYIGVLEEWFAAALVVVESNMITRYNELSKLRAELLVEASLHCSRLRTTSYSPRESFDSFGCDRVMNSAVAILGSVPRHLEAKFSQLEMMISEKFASDLLYEAETLIGLGYVRAAGAVAGVTLERHLKMLCERRTPPIEFSSKSTISTLNDTLKQHDVYDQIQWRKIQWMADIRNKASHDGLKEPRADEVQDFVREIRKFVSFFNI